ncbi:hypothetical protein [Helicobacter pylori]|uniref:hypothetical protein n=1 Tax=Helicobacter pylori TaxID=210 RepID=UPI00046DC10A|nr:hypothetical protein [Helicobacter pylori]
MAFKQAINQSINQTIKQSNNQTIKQTNNQTTLPYFYRFYQNLFKNPLLFIIPPFINPFILSLINPHRNLFKKFDSISPIFKSVGLTELNSIQGEDDGKSRSRVKKTPSNFSGC